jgi:transposase-like protein
VAKKHRVSDQTLYAWRKRFGTLGPGDVKRLRQLEHENARLKSAVLGVVDEDRQEISGRPSPRRSSNNHAS